MAGIPGLQAGEEVKLDVSWEPSALFSGAWTARIDPGGRWEADMVVGRESATWVADASIRDPISRDVPETVRLRWRSAPLGLFRHVRRVHVRHVSRFTI